MMYVSVDTTATTMYISEYNRIAPVLSSSLNLGVNTCR